MSIAESETTRFPPRRIGSLLKNRAFLTFLIVVLVWIVAYGCLSWLELERDERREFFTRARSWAERVRAAR